MKVLIVGNGGREHALAWKAAQSPLVREIYIAPGNAGTTLEAQLHAARSNTVQLHNVAIDGSDTAQLVTFAQHHHIDLTLVGPEIPLVRGIVDAFQQAGLKIVGPTQAAAQLEGSKAFMKAFLARHHIPTADYRSFDDLAPALDYVRQQNAPLVIKADGLAAGKGVVVAMTVQEAESAVQAMLAENAFGAAGQRIIIESFLSGEEVSFIVLVAGEQILPLATSQDHKAIGDGDQGLNTGGMGAYSPAPVVTKAIQQRILQEIIQPTVQGMAREGIPYSGFLYAGLMIMPDGSPKVIEFNCRLGDPETQPLMLRLRSDLVTLCLAATLGQLDQYRIEWDPRPALGVVLAAEGYPGPYQTGAVIEGLPPTPSTNGFASSPTDHDQKIFHAGTQQQGKQTVTRGGRVLCVTALGNSFAEAQQAAYRLVKTIQWPGIYYRQDIGHRALKREF